MKKIIRKFIPRFILNSYHWLVAYGAAIFYGFPAKKLVVIGVTGTNGKTTTCHMIASVLNSAGIKTAMATTVDFQIGDSHWINESKMTTLNSSFLQDFLRRALFAGCTHVVIETSSHALEQHRVAGIKYDTAVFTNLSHEHLDYHKTMERYFLAKEKLFKKARAVVVNGDDEFGKRLLRYGEERYEFRVTSDEFRVTSDEFRVNKHKGNSCLATRIQVIAGDVKTKNLLTSFNVVLNGMKNLSNQAALPNKIHFSINFPGRYNVQNALAAIGVGLSQKLSLETIARGLAKTQPVPGRSEFIDEGQPFRVLIDFALTPDSLQKLYDEVVTPIAKGKIIALFGSCGDRDRAKRPIMGQIAGKIADLVIITNDEPYHEDPQKIIDEIFAGVLAAGKTEGKNAFRIFDRGEAIDFAFSRARKDDIVVITGMGAETTMVVGDKHIPWNEREIVRAKLKQLVRQQKA